MDTTARIIEKRDLTDVTKLFVVHAPLVARNAAPGQFVILRVTETGERIPISITDFDRAAGTITIVVQEVGRTSALVGALEVGDDVPRLRRPARQPRCRCPGGPRGADRRRLRHRRGLPAGPRAPRRAACRSRPSSAPAPATLVILADLLATR